MNNKRFWVLAFAAVLAVAGNAHAVDSASVEVGNGDATDMWRVGVQWSWDQKWFTGGDWVLGGYWDLSLGAWDGDSNAGGNKNVTEAGLTPVFRWQQKTSSGLAPYLEGGIGFHLLSKTRINARREFGTAFQFGTHVGAGIRFGDRRQFDLGYRYQHLSNGGIKNPNDGINFNQLRLAYSF